MAEHVAVVMPAYNEAEGISGFIQEILGALEPLADELSVHVADDRSTEAVGLGDYDCCASDDCCACGPVWVGHGRGWCR